MKKYLPLILLGLGAIVLVGGFLFLKSRKAPENEEENVPEIPFEQRPAVSLTPSEDGHWLKLKIEKIKVEASTMDYELLYQLPDGRTQGVPGTIKLGSDDTIERDLLLGSESSGKFRYDEGVETGTLTLRFRNDKGKLIGKLSTQFHLQTDSQTLTSAEGSFGYVFDTKPTEGYFVTMNTFGVSQNTPSEIKMGPIGIFSSIDTEASGQVKMEGAKIYELTSDGWTELNDSQASNVGIFISTD